MQCSQTCGRNPSNSGAGNMPTYTTIGGQPGVYVPSGTPEMLLEIKEPAEHKATSSEKSPCLFPHGRYLLSTSVVVLWCSVACSACDSVPGSFGMASILPSLSLSLCLDALNAEWLDKEGASHSLCLEADSSTQHEEQHAHWSCTDLS